MADPLYQLAKWTIPFGMATTIIGGSGWLTTTHNLVSHVKERLEKLEDVYESDKKRMYDKIILQDQRLSRIEGKIDMMLEMAKRRAARSNRKNPR